MGHKRKRKDGDGRDVFVSPHEGRRSSFPPVELPQNLQAKRLHPQYPGALSVHSKSLQALLANPIRFVPATNATLKEEDNMPSDHRSSKESQLKLVESTKREGVHQHQHRYITKDIPSRWDKMAAMSSRGLPPGNNQCYRNSVYQALLHIPKFVNFVENHNDSTAVPQYAALSEPLARLPASRSCRFRGCVLCRLKDLSKQYWDQRTNRSRLEDRVKDVETRLRASNPFRYAKFSFRAQQDAPEFYGYLVQAIIENSIVKPTMDALFGHSLNVELCCPGCGYSYRYNTAKGDLNHTLQVKFDQVADTLENLLKKNVFPHHDFVEDYKCDSCGVKFARYPKQERIHTAPEILAIHLVRFQNDPKKKRAVIKNCDKIDFPEELDLTPFSKTNTKIKYQLKASILHSGSRTSGHYKAVVKATGSGWEMCDDDEVQKVKVHAARGTGTMKHSFVPYMLFYAKMDSYA